MESAKIKKTNIAKTKHAAAPATHTPRTLGAGFSFTSETYYERRENIGRLNQTQKVSGIQIKS